MKILRVGDPHVRPQNITESTNLMEKVANAAEALKVDRIEILGDLFHTHAVIRLEVMAFWLHWLEVLAKITHTVVITGNHDMSGDYGMEESALSVFRGLHANLDIIGLPTIKGIFGYLPYSHSSELFASKANALIGMGAKVIVCHQTFNGAKYENGFFAPDGVSPTDINCDLIISGHIHAKQRFVTEKKQQVIYPGTAKWDSASDANEEKGITLFTHDDDTGKIIDELFIPTADVCTPIIRVIWNEGEEKPEIKEGAKVNVLLVGSSDWISEQSKKLKGKVSISTKITDKKSEARKTGTGLEDFITNIYVSQADKTALIKYMKELSLV